VELRHTTGRSARISDLRVCGGARLGKLEGGALPASHGRRAAGNEAKNGGRPCANLGERRRYHKTMHQGTGTEGLSAIRRASYHDGAASTRIAGRTSSTSSLRRAVAKNLTLIIDGVDGPPTTFPASIPAGVADISIGSIVEIGSAEAGAVPADRRQCWQEGGRLVYRTSHHFFFGGQARFDATSYSGGEQ